MTKIINNCLITAIVIYVLYRVIYVYSAVDECLTDATILFMLITLYCIIGYCIKIIKKR